MGSYDSTHPIMQGISSFSPTCGFNSFNADVTIRPGGKIVANWADGRPFVVEDPNKNVVSISFFPGTNWCAEVAAERNTLFYNALTYTRPTPYTVIDDFEDCDVAGWDQSAGGLSVFEAQSSVVAEGGCALHLLNDAGLSHNGYFYNIGSAQTPSRISWYERAPTTNLHTAYLITRNNTTDLIFSFMQNSGSFYYGGTARGLYSANQWYFMEFTNVDWAHGLYDVSIDGAPTDTDMAFTNINPGGFNNFEVYAYSANAEAWYDSIAIGEPDVKVLVYTQYADMNPGAEYEDTLAAIDQVSAATGITYSVEQLADYTQLSSKLAGKDVLLVPEQGSLFLLLFLHIMI